MEEECQEKNERIGAIESMSYRWYSYQLIVAGKLQKRHVLLWLVTIGEVEMVTWVTGKAHHEG
jgi:hypothetical protein